jgi:hypothetical protein
VQRLLTFGPSLPLQLLTLIDTKQSPGPGDRGLRERQLCEVLRPYPLARQSKSRRRQLVLCSDSRYRPRLCENVEIRSSRWTSTSQIALYSTIDLQARV